MSGNFVKRSAAAWGIAVILSTLSAAEERPTEEGLIVRALLRDEARDYVGALEIFLRLYRLTGKEEYLSQAAKEAMMPGGKPQRVIPLLREWAETRASASADRGPIRMLVALYARGGKLREAEPYADRWLAGSDNPLDLKLAATLKSDLGKDREAVALLEKAYGRNRDEKLLLQEVRLLENRLGDRAGAIRLLETHLRLDPGAGKGVTFALIELYAKENRLGKVRGLYEKLYEKNPHSSLLQKIVKLALYRKDYDGLIRFLERHRQGNEELLYMLYKERKLYDKAVKLARKRYGETGNPKWLAEEAILRYEKARALKRVDRGLLTRFRELFDRALQRGADDSLYLNYYGYTLIDHDVDVDRGIALVRRALKQQPDNIYYLDSLAWGLYKKGECLRAAEMMKRVSAGEGMQEPEIRMHDEKIRACVDRGSEKAAKKE